MATEQEISNLYRTLLKREPETEGLQSWMGSGKSIQDIAAGIKGSSEYQERLNAPGGQIVELTAPPPPNFVPEGVAKKHTNVNDPGGHFTFDEGGKLTSSYNPDYPVGSTYAPVNKEGVIEGPNGAGTGGGAGTSDQTVDFSNQGLANDPAWQEIKKMLGDLLPSFQKSIANYGDLENLLDKYKTDAMGTGRITFDDIWKTINQAANVSAARGVGGGTEQRALLSSMLGDLAKREEDRKLGILDKVTGLKTTARMAGPGTMYSSLQALMNMFGTEESSNLNWAQQISNLITQGY